MDSDQSEELFSDDDTAPIAKLFSPNTSENNSPVASCPLFSQEFSPLTQSLPSTVLIPRTPLSLIQFISKEAPGWTSDLETPERSNKPSPLVNSANAIHHQINDKSLSIDKNIPTTPTADEIIPASQYVRKRRVKKIRPSRRILANENNISELDERPEAQNVLGITVEDSKNPDALAARLSPAIDQTEFNSKQTEKSSVLSSLAARVAQLKESRKRSLIQNQCVDIPDSVFTKTLRLLESKDKFVPERKLPKPPAKLLGFVPFSVLYANENEIDDKFTANVEEFGEADFLGFSADCHSNSQLYSSKFEYFLRGIIQNEFKLHTVDEFHGFSTQEAEESIALQQNFDILFSSIVNNNGQRSQSQISVNSSKVGDYMLEPFIIYIPTGFNTAAGDNIMIDSDNLSKAKCTLLRNEAVRNNLNIDILLSNNSNNWQSQKTKSPVLQNDSDDIEFIFSSELGINETLDPVQVPEDTVIDEFTQIYMTQSVINSESQKVSENVTNVHPSIDTLSDEEFDLPPTQTESNIKEQTSEYIKRNEINEISEVALKQVNTIFSGENVVAENHELNDKFEEFSVVQADLIESVPQRMSGSNTRHDKSMELTEDIQRAEEIYAEEFELNNHCQFIVSQPEVIAPQPGTSKSSISTMIGFTTGHYKSININEGALKQAKHMYNKESALVKEQNLDDIEFTIPKHRLNKTPENLEITTGHGKNIEISDEALRQTEIYSEDSVAMKDLQFDDFEFPEPKPGCSNSITPITIGFTTGHGKSIKIKEVALKRANQIYNTESALVNEKNFDDIKFTIPKHRLSKTPKNLGFSTCRDHSIKIKEATLKQAGKMYSEESSVTKDMQFDDFEFTEPEPSCSNSDTPLALGFTTGHGESIKIKEAALKKAGKIYNEECALVNEQNVHNIEFTIPKRSCSKSRTPVNVGFTSSRGQSIKINKAAVRQADAIYGEESAVIKDLKFDDFEYTEPKPSCSKSTTPVTIGFRTGHGESIKIDKGALTRANKIYNEESVLVNKQNFDNIEFTIPKRSCTKPSTPVNVGFTTGHGSTIKIAKEALQQANAMYSEENNLLAINPEDPFKGFQKVRASSAKLLKSALSNSRTKIPTSNDVSIHTKSVDKQKNSSTIDDLSKKRKHTTDDETPTGRKKARTDTDLQRRKLFSELEEDEEQLSESALYLGIKMASTDRNISNEALRPIKSIDEVANSTQNIFAKEIREVTAAFMMETSDDDDDMLSKWKNNDNHVVETKQNRSNCSAITALSSTITNKTNETSKRARSLPSTSTEIIPIEAIDSKIPSRAPSPIQLESIPDDVCFDSPFSQEFTDVVELTREKRSAAILEQQRIIQAKKSRCEKPTTGSLLRLKETNSRISLEDFFGNSSRAIKMPEELSSQAIDPAVLSINSSTAATYKFNCLEFYGDTFIINHSDGIPLDDNAILIPNDQLYAGSPEFQQSFLAMPGVDPSLLPVGWFENHYRWIIWKLASMDRLKTDKKPLLRFLTPDRVMAQLKYRYDREIDRSQRPPLRRILEKDDAPSRRLILCVSKILETTNQVRGTFKISQTTLELTDGWYSVLAVTDHAMHEYIVSKKVTIGTKLMIYGAELLNLDEGCYPLDVRGDVRLKIHTNSTRRARWNTKLGYQRQCGPMKLSLGSIHPNGGLVGKLVVAIARVYPILYREKTGDGKFIDRNARCEEKAANAYERECQSRIDAVYSKADERLNSSKSDLENYVRNNLPARRNITAIAKIKVTDGENIAMLTLSCGAEESQFIFKENSSTLVQNVFVTGKRSNELQLTAGRYTTFTQVPSIISSPKRIFTSLKDVSSPTFNPCYSEFDTVGIVVSRGPAPHGMKNFETVNLAFIENDNDSSTSYYLSILFWQGAGSYGFTEITTVGSFVACSNLEWRKNTYRSIPTAFCTERTVLTCNPRQNYLRQPFEELRERISDTAGNYIETCAVAIQTEIAKKTKLTPRSRDNTPNNSYRDCSTPQTADNSLVNLNVTPLSDRKKAIQARLDKLSNYGPAPNISPLNIGRSSKASLEFKSPVTRDK